MTYGAVPCLPRLLTVVTAALARSLLGFVAGLCPALRWEGGHAQPLRCVDVLDAAVLSENFDMDGDVLRRTPHTGHERVQTGMCVTRAIILLCCEGRGRASELLWDAAAQIRWRRGALLSDSHDQGWANATSSTRAADRRGTPPGGRGWHAAQSVCEMMHVMM